MQNINLPEIKLKHDHKYRQEDGIYKSNSFLFTKKRNLEHIHYEIKDFLSSIYVHLIEAKYQ